MRRPIRLIASILTLLAVDISFSALAQDAPATGIATAICSLEPTEIYHRTEKSVLKVLSIRIDPMRLAGRVQAGTGSAIALGDGHFVTNYHVVGQSDEAMLVAGEAFLPASVIGRDPALDIAVLYSPMDAIMRVAERLPSAPEGELKPGQRVYAIGFPLGIGRSISGGMISAVDRFLPLNTTSWTTRYIQTDAAISPGNSGGALVDQCGRLLGMVSVKSVAPGAENIAYALPNETIAPLIPELIETGRVARPWHGIYGQMVTPLILALLGADPRNEISGFLIETIEPGSGADRAGLRGGQLPVLWGMGEFVLGGDIVTHVNGLPIISMREAIKVVDALKIGDIVKVDFLRDGVSQSTTISLEERPIFDSDAFLYSPR